MSATSRVPADQPNQRRAARKVSRASSSPLSTSSDTPVRSTDGGEHVVAVGGLADGARDEAAEVLDALVLGDVEALLHEVGEPVAALVGDQARRR